MSNNTEIESTGVESATTKPKAAKTKETISFLSTAVPLFGVLGTAFVWLAANFYVGTVDIKPSTEYQEIVVKVFDQKGVEREFHTPHFLIEPGKYHMAINVDNKGVHQIDTEVVLGKTANINVVDKDPQADASESASAKHKHWWQFWKKSEDGESVNAQSATQTNPVHSTQGRSNSDSEASAKTEPGINYSAADVKSAQVKASDNSENPGESQHGKGSPQ